MSFCKPWQNSIDSVQAAFAYMYKHRLHTDVTLRINSKESSDCSSSFSAHKLVLAIFSPVFEDAFRNGSKQQCTIKNENISSTRGFDILLWYMYTGCLDIQSVTEIIEVTKAAKYYDILCALHACELYLLGFSINTENVFTVLEVLKYFEIDSKRKECLDFIEKEAVKIIRTSEFLKADQGIACRVLKHSNLSCDLKELTGIIINWIQYNKAPDKNLLSYIDFSTMTSDDFEDIAEKFPDFFNENEIVSILANFEKPGTIEYPHCFSVSTSIIEEDVIERPVLYTDVYNLIKESSLEVKTECNYRLWKACFLNRDKFQASVALELKVLSGFTEATSLVMLELAFGSAFVPESCLNFNIFFRLDPSQEKQNVNHCIIPTPRHFYIILDRKMKLLVNRCLIVALEINAEGLRRWGTDGPVFNEQYRVANIPEGINYNVYSTSPENTVIYLTILSEWIVFIEPKNGEKKFAVTSLFFDTDSNHEKFVKIVGL